MKELQQRDKQAFAQSGLAQPQEGYSAANTPTKAFVEYISSLKEAGKGNVSELDRYNYFKDAVPKRIHKINSSLQKAFKQDDKEGDADEQLLLVKTKIQDRSDEIAAERGKIDELGARIKELKKTNKDLQKKNKLDKARAETSEQ